MLHNADTYGDDDRDGTGNPRPWFSSRWSMALLWVVVILAILFPFPW